ncbi:MAG: hypothetical protein PSV13_15835 [Lacunisphaera sp.]|nr:hypothetical protein [Lacunisphaera sp.]
MTTSSGPGLAPRTEPTTGPGPCAHHARDNPGGRADRRIRRGLFALGFALRAARPGLAARVGDTRPPNTPAGVKPVSSLQALGDDELILDEVFHSHLPGTLQKYGFRLSVNPHLGDWQKKDHLRLTTNLRYGLTENCEVGATSNLYFSHGHREVRAFENYGAASLKLGAKYNLGQRLIPGWETGVGLDYEFPTGRPPAELTDGLRHLRSYITFSHRLESHPDLRIFVGLRGDNIAQTAVPGTFGKNSFQESSTGITGGWVLDRANWHYTFEASCDTTRLIGNSEEDIFTIRPGVLWEIPTRRNRQIMSHWMVGVALNHTYGPGGNSLGASFKLRYSRDLKYRRHRAPVDPTP